MMKKLHLSCIVLLGININCAINLKRIMPVYPICDTAIYNTDSLFNFCENYIKYLNAMSLNKGISSIFLAEQFLDKIYILKSNIIIEVYKKDSSYNIERYKILMIVLIDVLIKQTILWDKYPEFKLILSKINFSRDYMSYFLFKLAKNYNNTLYSLSLARKIFLSNLQFICMLLDKSDFNPNLTIGNENLVDEYKKLGFNTCILDRILSHIDFMPLFKSNL